MVEKNSENLPVPWYQIRMLWLVIGGPAIVVIASFVSLGLALKFPDPVLRTAPAEKVGTLQGRSSSASSGSTVVPAETPAMQGRNHAVTGGQ